MSPFSNTPSSPTEANFKKKNRISGQDHSILFDASTESLEAKRLLNTVLPKAIRTITGMTVEVEYENLPSVNIYYHLSDVGHTKRQRKNIPPRVRQRGKTQI